LRALAIVDGEHYAPVVRDALAELAYEFVAAVFVGGQEKLRGGEDYGVPVVADVESAVAEYAPDVVVDLFGLYRNGSGDGYTPVTPATATLGACRRRNVEPSSS